MMPGCQVITTVIDKDGNTVAQNQIWMKPEGKGLDTAAVQPHTAGRRARDCESCHNNQEICLPEQNRDDEVRWAFMKWAKQNFGERRRPATEGVLATLKQAFPCK